MKKTLYLLTFNNYYNRLVKGYETIAEYLDAASNYQVFPTMNWFASDGVATSQTINTLVKYNFDYVLVVDELTNQIESRWFIVESIRNNGGQYLLSLIRDVVYDYYNVIISSPCFIEKATIPASNPLIYNQEDFTANQIKTSETLLRDRTQCAWLVGYLDPTKSIENISIRKETKKPTEFIGELVNWKFYNYSNIVGSGHDGELYQNGFKNLTISFFAFDQNNNLYQVRGNYSTREISISLVSNATLIVANMTTAYTYSGDNFSKAIEKVMTDIFNLNEINFRQYILPNYNGNIAAFDNTVLEDDDTKFYEAVLINGPTVENTDTILQDSALYITLKNIVLTYLGKPGIGEGNLRYTADITQYKLYLTPSEAYTYNFSLDVAKNRTNDIYRIICIPYPNEGEVFGVVHTLNDQEEENSAIEITRDAAITVAKAIMRQGGATVYDFQLLPYCPLIDSWILDPSSAGRPIFDLQGDDPMAGGYTTVGDKCVIFEVPEPSFSFNIDVSINISNVKVENQLDMYRLCSPNYAAMFEFNAARNGGVQYFNVDCCYKPFTPYIHVNPNFGGLYGQDFNDPRGLICSGDFSLSSIQDAFVNYELQNKNYQSIFNRSIENMEVQHKYARQQEGWQVATGTVQGAVSGATTGALVGGGWGALIGGVGGSVASLAGGVADMYYNNKLRAEALDYTKDMYGFNLENIKAMPNTLTKVSAFNGNNKIYPVLEYYTCTEVEREAFKNKIKYNGMTVGVIDKIENYLQVEPTYIKGKIIRLEDLEEDFHIAKVISDEIYKGVFI